MRFFRTVVYGYAVVLCVIGIFCHTVQAAQDKNYDQQAAKLYGKAYQPELADWLPKQLDSFAPGTPRKQGLLHFGDSFIHTDGKNIFTSQYGTAAGSGYAMKNIMIRIAYDPVHRLAFISQGCCSWAETDFMANISPPPVPVREVDLSRLHTHRGAAIGDSIKRILQIYGYAPLTAVAGHPHDMRLSYKTTIDTKEAKCGEYNQFVFHDQRLSIIQLVWGC